MNEYNKTILEQRMSEGKMRHKAIFLDRDGTINAEKNYIYRISDFVFLPGVLDALMMLQKAGFKLLIVTNQSGIGRGYYTERDFEILNSWMIAKLSELGIRVEKVYYCPHLPDAKVEVYRQECECRKPKLGLFYQAITDFNLDISRCYAIGDKIRDCQICSSTECKGYLIGNNESKDIITSVIDGNVKNVKYKRSLLDASIDIIKNEAI